MDSASKGDGFTLAVVTHFNLENKLPETAFIEPFSRENCG